MCSFNLTQVDHFNTELVELRYAAMGACEKHREEKFRSTG